MIRSFRMSPVPCGLALMMMALLWLFPSPAPAQPPKQRAVAAIEKLGGTARPMAGAAQEWDVEFHLHSQALTDDGLVHGAELNVVSLNLRDTRITIAGLVHLKGLTNLRRLHLEPTAIDDAAAEALAGLVSEDAFGRPFHICDGQPLPLF